MRIRYYEYSDWVKQYALFMKRQKQKERINSWLFTLDFGV